MNCEKTLILVVDDDRLLVQLIATALEQEGYTVEKAYNGQDALNQVARKTPNLILSDLCMPLMDGWTLCRQLKQRAQTRRIPVIIMSADRRRDKPISELDVVEYLDKPFEMEDLLYYVRKHAIPNDHSLEPQTSSAS